MAWYYGSDTGTGSGTPCGASYYIGRKGAGTDAPGADLDWTLPSGSTLPAASYWNLIGPSGHSNPTQWGKDQANAYTDAWNSYASSGTYVPSGDALFTLFGSIDNPGYTDPTDNAAMVDGYIEQIYSNFGSYKTYGLYGNPSEFASLGSGWGSLVPLVIWVAYYGRGFSCPAVQGQFCDELAASYGGYAPMIWQYNGSPDYNVTPYNGFESGMWHPTSPPGIC